MYFYCFCAIIGAVTTNMAVQERALDLAVVSHTECVVLIYAAPR